VFFAVEDSYIIGFLSTEAVRRPDLSWLRRGEETSQVEVRSEAVASDSGARLDLQRYQNEGGKVEPSDIPEVALGVRQVWVREPYRGRGVATILVDAARRAFLLGSAPRRQLVAFSQPTVEGARFAFAYAAAQDRMLTYSHAS
jgi:GNAT superfamily N-acetyltransferase